jgi:putative flavoprotein involved in K+ transport
MASQGIILLGRMNGFVDGRLILASDLKENMVKGDKWFDDFKRSVDDYIEKTRMDCEQDPAEVDLPDPNEVTSPILEMDLIAAGINSIVWSSGFRYDFDWVKLSIFDATGEPLHRRGVTRAAGVYFLGLQWLYKLKSAFLSLGGPEEDAAYLAEQIIARS